MRVSVFGLGYVGTVTAGCLAAAGHDVIGVDPQADKCAFIADGRSPILEEGAEPLIAAAVAAGRLRATGDAVHAVQHSDISFVCVGTPSAAGGRPDYGYVARVCEEIGAALGGIDHRHTVNIRSTVLPGTMRGLVLPTLERASGKRAGVDFGLCHNPEFLREGSAIADYHNPPKTVIGEINPVSGDVVATLYAGLPGPMLRTGIETAEMVKFTDNVWHALKVGFANEIGTVCKQAGVDSHAVMDIFCKDTKLNISPYYLRPGFAFGGSCLPKDTRALIAFARQHEIALPIVEHILPSNAGQIARGLEMVRALGRKRVAVLGCSFKAGTDDLRESPLVELIEQLIGKGYEVCVYDRNVRLASLTGANRAFILDRIPHIARLLVETIEDALAFGEIVVIGNGDPEFRTIGPLLRADHGIVDLVRVPNLEGRAGYHGVSW